MKHSVQVTICGQQYTIRSEAPPQEVEKVAAFVNDRIEEVVASRKSVDTLNSVVLALLNVAGEYLRLQAAGPGGEDRLRNLLQRLEQAVPEAADGQSGNEFQLS